MKRVGFILLVLLLHSSWVQAAPYRHQNVTHRTQHKRVMPSIQRRFYIVPGINLGALYHADNYQISGLMSFPALGAHYRVSPKFTVAFMGNHWLKYTNEKNRTFYLDVFDLMGKYRFYSSRLGMLPKRIHMYGQGGVWYGFATDAVSWEQNLLQGSGLAAGVGVCYEMSRFFIDVSYKRLQPLGYKDISGINLLSVGFGISRF